MPRVVLLLFLVDCRREIDLAQDARSPSRSGNSPIPAVHRAADDLTVDPLVALVWAQQQLVEGGKLTDRQCNRGSRG
ncbi:MAG TPA: hypothetical protein DDY14_13785 [Chromatiaceae bacterium]|nr:hypothetical protein [Chromatiaceae bacterium]HCS90671.1 hypothetical protein [Chromatiaceae bacterium]